MNLVETSALLRKVIAGIGMLVALYLIFLITAPVVKSMFYSVFPPKDLPNPIFGQLQPLEFIEKQVTTSNLSFELNTKDGKLPRDFPKNMVVYKYAKPQFSYSAGKDAQIHANALGFEDDELISDLKGTTYKWRDKQTGGILEINTTTQKLTLNTPLFGKETLLSKGNITKQNAKTIAKQQLIDLGRFTDSLYKKGYQTVALAKIREGELTETDFAPEAQVARVDFFRSINEYPILAEDPTKGLINMTIAAPTNVNKSLNNLQISYTQWPLISTKETNIATYPIITVQQAWEAITNNEGVIVSVVAKNDDLFSSNTNLRVDKIMINEIYLAYYDVTEAQEYLQPIYVFAGTYNVGNKPGGEIVIYFPAIAGEYILDTSEPNL